MSANLMVSVSLSRNVIGECQFVSIPYAECLSANLTMSVCLAANFVVSVSLSGNPVVSVSVSVSVRDTIYFSFLFDSVPRCHMPGL